MHSETKIICETKRLYLRELTADDAKFAYELNSNPNVIKYTGDVAFISVEEARQFLLAYSHYREYGFGRWGVVNKEDECLLGWCGLKFDNTCGEHDLGYRFFEEYWNKGYASEAAEVCMRLAFEQFEIKVLVANADKQNVASRRVLEKIGMQLLPECGRHEHEVKFAISKKQWLDRKFTKK